MNERSAHRLVILRVLIISLFAVLIGRLYAMQIVDGDEYQNRASDGRVREIVDPATRGVILDQMGRTLVGNRSTIVVSISATTLSALEDDGDAVLKKLAPLLNTTPSDLRDKLIVCGTEGAKKPPVCWNGSPYQPIPVAKDISLDTAVRIMERQIDFPGVIAATQAEREIPNVLNANLAHILGYLGPVNDDELNGRKGTNQELQSTDLIGRAGVESYYDDYLRGVPGVTALSIDRSMAVIGTLSKTQPQPGSYLVLGVDAALQRVVEDQLQAAINRARDQGFRGDSGAAVVMDVTNGQILAMASYPTYNPRIWLDGVTQEEYKNLTSSEANAPLTSRVTQGLFAPASTFKVITAAAAAQAKMPLGSTLYACPSSVKIGNRTMENHESQAYGNITVTRAIEVSCNTVFYQMGYGMWLRDGGNSPVGNPKDPIEKMAKQFGLGRKTGIDLPSESRGRVGGRSFKTEQYAKFKDLWCYRSEVGYPDIAKKDPTRATYLKALAKENCVDGGVFRGGDAANLAIGQGDTVVTPLQLASVYAAYANGGTLWTPHVVKAVVSADGKTVTPITPKVSGKVKLPPSVRNYVTNALQGVISDGTGRSPFYGWPQSQIPIAAKTGSGEAGADRDPTSWFASFAPANNPRYAVVVMVNEGGTGSLTSGPSVRKIYEAIFGVSGSSVDPKNSVFFGGQPSQTLPRIASDGSVTVVPGTLLADKTLIRRYGRGN